MFAAHLACRVGSHPGLQHQLVECPTSKFGSASLEKHHYCQHHLLLTEPCPKHSYVEAPTPQDDGIWK